MENQKAVTAFYGGDDLLMEKILLLNGYEMDGHFYPANSISLAECIETVKKMEKEAPQ
jgi:hypothetical protein